MSHDGASCYLASVSTTSNTTWAEFRERYEDEVLASLSTKHEKGVCTVFNWIEKILNPRYVRDLTSNRLSYFQTQLRSDLSSKGGKATGREETTIESYLRSLKPALKWAADMGMIQSVPKVKMPRRTKKNGKQMKGRPITLEEFERMTMKVEAGLRIAGKRTTKATKGKVSDEARAKREEKRTQRLKQIVPLWQRLIEGLWLSGLRLDEALNLSWDDPRLIRVDLDGKRPMFDIPGEMQKNGRDTLTPITPDFYDFLMKTPAKERTGPVFALAGLRRRDTGRPGIDYVSKVISAIGEAANVKVNETASGKVKFASARDLRRSFGERWARRVMPVVLKELMRHEDIETTMRYYVGQNAQATADAIWEASGNTLGNTSPIQTHTCAK